MVEAADEKRAILVNRLQGSACDSHATFRSTGASVGRSFGRARAVLEQPKNPLRLFADAIEDVPQLFAAGAGGAGSKQTFAVANQLLEPVIAHRNAEVLCGHVFQLMRFVDDGVLALRNHFAVRALPDR